MAHWLRRLGLVAALLVLAGCAGEPSIPYDRSTAGNIKTIGILTPRFPEEPKVILATSVGQSFGLIGAIIDSSMEAHRESAFAALLADQRYQAADSFSRALAQAVEAQGYKVEMIPVTRDLHEGLLRDYHVATNISVDAYLDVSVGGYGYIAAGLGGSNPYRPVVALGCRLVYVGDSKVLMQDFIVYNLLNPRGNIITLSPDPAYAFPDFDSLMADPPKATAGLDGALTQAAQAVGKLLH